MPSEERGLLFGPSRSMNMSVDIDLGDVIKARNGFSGLDFVDDAAPTGIMVDAVAA